MTLRFLEWLPNNPPFLRVDAVHTAVKSQFEDIAISIIRLRKHRDKLLDNHLIAPSKNKQTTKE